MKNILFVCTGNCCRSQMAEGIGRALSRGRFEIKSAGTAPIGILPVTIRSMKEIGIDISEQTSDFLSPSLLQWADYLVTLCNTVLDRLPLKPHGLKHIHWDIENPDRVYLSEEARLKGFAKTRDDIKKHIEELFEELD